MPVTQRPFVENQNYHVDTPLVLDTFVYASIDARLASRASMDAKKRRGLGF
jgi:hypothetical protein